MSNDTQTLTLTDFLLARIAEDKAAATTALQPPAYEHYGDTAAEECWRMAKSEGCSPDGYRFHRAFDPARIHAECEAKLRILKYVSVDWRQEDAVGKMLALPYADHPDYRKEWRP